MDYFWELRRRRIKGAVLNPLMPLDGMFSDEDLLIIPDLRALVQRLGQENKTVTLAFLIDLLTK